MDKIELEAQNDHELLVMSVMQGNDTVTQQEKMVQQQEKIVDHLATLNGTVRNNRTWICALRYAVYALFIILIGTVTTAGLGVW